ncbi:MAG: hypothetical protein ASARMPRED_002458 [Alectoria sarmentosa]|nr:MAG: hypothetical protein ASARMPRED_002458 [Alectoria sarmentosa]
MEALRNWLADQYPHLISLALAAGDDANKVYLKVVAQHSNDNTEEGEMISFAVWELPDDDMAPKDSGGIKARPPPGINCAFQWMICHELENMRNRVVNGRKCFLLNQVFTFPNHQRRGAGSLLVTWPIEQADKEGLICYLDSEADGEGIKLYESLGFVKVDECHVDLTMCGLEGTYTHVAMVRQPKKLVLKYQETESSNRRTDALLRVLDRKKGPMLLAFRH